MNQNREYNAQNFIPLPYRQVSVQPYNGPMTEEAILAHLMGKDSYRRTRYVVLEQGDRCAVAAVKREDETPLFSDITGVSILALPNKCVLVEDDEVDTGNPSSLGAKAMSIGMGPESTLVVRGLDGHVNFIHHPNPLRIRLIDVIPPTPSKLLRMAEQVLSYTDLPPVQLVPEYIDIRDLAAQTPNSSAYLIPCRASGLNFNVPTYFLDERPTRQNWTMIGCERSRQIHRHYYNDEAPSVEMCPKKLVQVDGNPTLTKCCLLEDHIEAYDNCVIVPWGANLALVEKGLRELLSISNMNHNIKR